MRHAHPQWILPLALMMPRAAYAEDLEGPRPFEDLAELTEDLNDYSQQLTSEFNDSIVNKIAEIS